MEKLCTVEECPERFLAKGFCKKHYYAKRREDIRTGVLPTAPCSVESCERPILAKALCASHYIARRDSARRAAIRQESRPCVICGADLTGRRPNAMYCTIRCKERAEMERRRGRPDEKAKARRRYLRRAAKQRDDFVSWAYRLTPEQYTQLLASQDGVCAICKQAPENRRLAVDHDHATGRIRGLLCSSCNNGLGRFRDDPQRLQAAINYLSR